MIFFYHIFIFFYSFAIRVAALFNPKAALWVSGRKQIFERIEKSILEKDPQRKKKTAWFHCASLGEFEQGRPVIEAYRQSHPENFILVTFFSPSGYEIRKNYPLADFIFYLPPDTKSNARRFIKIVNPALAVFVKYEYWYNYLSALRRNNVKTYVISAIFRPSQYFFKWYGAWFRKKIAQMTWFFVQDAGSLNLLNSAGIRNASVSGDTRFDRVSAIRNTITENPAVEAFCQDEQVIVAGSTWPEDEKILLSVLRDRNFKLIIAPHETDKARIQNLIEKIDVPVLKYSDADKENAAGAKILIIDSIGILSSLYHYATVAYIGGGFGAGIHNILEAAAFGIPVIFGPNHLKFREANDLIRLGGAFSIENGSRLVQILDNPGILSPCGMVCSKYVDDNQGATQRIMEHL